MKKIELFISKNKKKTFKQLLLQKARALFIFFLKFILIASDIIFSKN